MSLVNSAQWLSHLPQSEVGAYAVELSRLHQQKIPLPQSFCVPVSALKLIAQHNNLEGKIEQIEKSEHGLIQVKKLIRQQSIPSKVLTGLNQFYQQQLDSDFVRLVASPTQRNETDYKRESNIRGEANLIESILKLWARNLTLHDFSTQKYFPVAIVIQAQPQPQASGLAYSQNPETGNKTELVIDSAWGVFQPKKQLGQKDRYVVDASSFKILSQKTQAQTDYYYRQLDGLEIKSSHEKLINKISLLQNQAIKLAKLIRKIKLQRVHHLKIHWELVDDQLIITKIKPFAYSSDASMLHSLQTKTVVIGKPVTSGFISGRAQIISNKKDIKNFEPGKIALVEELSANQLGLIQTASGIICQKSIKSQEVLSKIKQFNLPVVTQALHALSKIKNNQEIVLDANSGKVYLTKKEQPSSHLEQQTQPAILLAVNHPNEISADLDKITQGIGILRSEHLFIEKGIHPLRLIQSKPDQLKQSLAKEVTSYYYRSLNSIGRSPTIAYRSLNLTSRQLSSLKYGQAYEEQEANPYLGWRGGIKSLRHSQLFQFELELISYLNQQIDQPINLLLPFVRSPLELERLTSLIDQICQSEVTNPPVWLQINTPENLLNLPAYLQSNISGITINTNSIHHLLQAVDPQNQELSQLYPLNNQLMKKLITKAVKGIKDQAHPSLKIQLNLSQINHELISLADQLKLDALVVWPSLAKTTKEALLEIQAL